MLKVAPDVLNLAGGSAFNISEELELCSILFTSFVTDQFYRSGQTVANRLAELAMELDPEFVAKAALTARTQYSMRTGSHIVTAELAKRVKGAEWMKHFVSRVIRRPDDMTEILAYYVSKYGKRPIPHSLRNGFALALQRFDEYQLAKYKGIGKEVNLLDLVRLCHPVPTEALTKLIRDILPPPETWEVGLMQASEAEDVTSARADVWKDLLASGKLGYFALIRNLLNIAKTAPELIDEACLQICDFERILGSRALPFRQINGRTEPKC